MSRELQIVPDGWLCTLDECPPGPFVYADQLCFKSEYRTNAGKIEAYNSAGEFFSVVEGAATIVQPVIAVWREDEREG